MKKRVKKAKKSSKTKSTTIAKVRREYNAAKRTYKTLGSKLGRLTGRK
jgi:hypothetical protein